MDPEWTFCLQTLDGSLDNVPPKFSPDGLLILASKDEVVRTWDPASGSCLGTQQYLPPHYISAVTSWGNRVLISSEDNGEIKTWNLSDSTCLQTFIQEVQSELSQADELKTGQGVGSRVRSMRHYQMKSRLNIWHSLTMASFLLKHMARRDSAGVRFHDVPTRPKLGHPLANSAMIQSLRPFWVRPMDGKPRPKQGDAPTLTVGGNWRCRRVGAEGL